jgi:hypothetical protein
VVQELINLLPREAGNSALIVAIIGSLIGAGIWLLGARFSRPIITLLTVLLGATVGMHLPQWFGWNISGAGPAVGGALVLGVTGYVLHGMWVGIGLGTVLSSWAAMACWIAFRNNARWAWPEYGADTSVLDYSRALWQALPPDVARVLPYACATAMVCGLGLAIIWPKVSLILGWSLAGATLLASMGVAAVDFGGQNQWLAKVPSPLWAQGTLLACFVALGSVIQWKLGPKPATTTGSKSGGKKKPKDDFDED